MHSSPNIFRVNVSRTWGHAARTGDMRGSYWVWCGNIRERDHLVDPGVNGSLTLRYELECGSMDWIDWLRIE